LSYFFHLILEITFAEFIDLFGSYAYQNELPCVHQAAWKHEPSSLPPGWPTNGCIDIRGLGLRYRHDLDLAIRNITIKIDQGEKVRL